MRVLGLPVHKVDADDLLSFMDEVISNNQKAVILNLNVQGVNLSVEHPWVADFFRRVHMVHCDGDGVRMGLRMLGHTPPPKVTYNVWFWQICASCESKEQSLFFLGSKPGIAAEAAERARERFPRIKIVGVHEGYFAKEGPENDEVLVKINEARPDILLTCFGMPVQEMWIRENWQKIDSHVFLAGGAALEYAAGRVPIAPGWMVRMHLEWLFRFLLEPRRLFSRYIVGNPLFLCRVLRERLGRSRG